MEIMELIQSRHSVRQYLDKKIPADIREQLNSYASELNRDGDLNIRNRQMTQNNSHRETQRYGG